MTGVYQLSNRKKSNWFNSLNVNTSLILVNVALFFVFYLLINLNILTWDFVAIKPASILQGAYLWTFLTSMFMHGNLFHLFVNMMSLFFVGSLIKRILGTKRYLSFYIFAGVFASLFFVVFTLFFPADFNTYAVGASGALFGLIGLMMILTPDLPVYLMFVPIPIKIKYAAPGMMVVLWLISIGANVPIGNTAHLGGLIFGLGYGLYLNKKYKKKVRAIRQRFR